jgi:GGDEF domain-containing protein
MDTVIITKRLPQSLKNGKKNLNLLAWKSFLRIILNLFDIWEFEGKYYEITTNIGIRIAGKRNLAYLDMLKNSDTAMYQVKDSGKNNFRFYDSEKLSQI